MPIGRTPNQGLFTPQPADFLEQLDPYPMGWRISMAELEGEVTASAVCDFVIAITSEHHELHIAEMTVKPRPAPPAVPRVTKGGAGNERLLGS